MNNKVALILHKNSWLYLAIVISLLELVRVGVSQNLELSSLDSALR